MRSVSRTAPIHLLITNASRENSASLLTRNQFQVLSHSTTTHTRIHQHHKLNQQTVSALKRVTMVSPSVQRNKDPIIWSELESDILPMINFGSGQSQQAQLNILEIADVWAV